MAAMTRKNSSVERATLICIVLSLMVDRTSGFSFNQPRLCLEATWNPNAITFADSQTIGSLPDTVFVDGNNSVYVAETQLSQVQVWMQGAVVPDRNISAGLFEPHGLFVTNNGDIYVDNSVRNNRTDKWAVNDTDGVAVMNVSESCYSLFVDIDQMLYCSMGGSHQVLKQSLNNLLPNITIIAAGNGTQGASATMLDNPHGIFVDEKLRLYVADCGNNRIERFESNVLNGTMVAGAGVLPSLSLLCPVAVILDGNGYLFIADSQNSRILMVGTTDFRCIIGCVAGSGSGPSQLNSPWSLSFDTNGNLFVSDRNNSRIQKFMLLSDGCGSAYNQPQFCASATWTTSAKILEDVSSVGTGPRSLFVDTSNSLYVSATSLNLIEVWGNGKTNPTRTINGSLSTPAVVFFTPNGDIYTDSGDDGNSTYRVEKWSVNANSRVIVMFPEDQCFDLFLDIYGNIYCSMAALHQVVQRLCNDDINTTSIVAGNGTNGSASNMLSSPRGIFVNSTLDLYVADCDNNRVQLFLFGQLNAQTVVGNDTIDLNCPTGIVVDGNGYLFITDSGNNRIIGSGPDGYRCVAGCSRINGSALDQLSNPGGLRFDAVGSLFVADSANDRIMKFSFIINSCGEAYNQPLVSLCATWNPYATTFANSSTIGASPSGVFVDTDNNVYISAQSINSILIWAPGNMSVAGNISTSSTQHKSVLVTSNGDIYVDAIASNQSFTMYQVQKWTMNATSWVTVMSSLPGGCSGLFVDIYDAIYCSVETHHQVVRRLLTDDVNTTSIVAGNDNGTSGSTMGMLSSPRGIFVTRALVLYVADCRNNRVQSFQPGQRIATTAIGSWNIALNCPTGIAMDGYGYLFVTDSGNNRIIGLGMNGYRCVAGCSTASGSGSAQLNNPYALSFDSKGNIYVADQNNNRTQKFLLGSGSCTLAYNQPKFSTCARWYPHAVTFTNESTIGILPVGIFVDTSGSVYVPSKANGDLLVWLAGNSTPARTLPGSPNGSYSTFVTSNGDIYVDNGLVNRSVNKWPLNSTTSSIVMSVDSLCYGLFVDIFSDIYCSLSNLHQVVRRLSTDTASTGTIVAGNGTNGSTSDMLSSPRGIFVTLALDLYVADCGNNRVQLFRSGQRNASTIVGNDTIDLNCPIGIVLDGKSNLFITDGGNNRIFGSGPEGYRCVAGCSRGAGSGSNQLNNPRGLSFDPYGNIYVVDGFNNRVQQFILASNSCGMAYNQPKFCPTTAWNPDAVLSVNSTDVGSSPYDVFVDVNNIVYVAGRSPGSILAWSERNATITTNISTGSFEPSTVFVTSNGDIYTDSGYNSTPSSEVLQWAIRLPGWVPVMLAQHACFDIFIDGYGNVYCSIELHNQVIRQLSTDDLNTTSIVGGNGTNGSASNMLSSPRGIFVNSALDLYVADCGNHRVQLFQSGQRNASTVVDNNNIDLNCPTGIVLDGNGYLFITDTHNNRIIGSGPDGYRCMVGCSHVNGSGSSQLNNPRGLSFDSAGNLFVADTYNSRILKFMLALNSCDVSTAATSTTVGTAVTSTTVAIVATPTTEVEAVTPTTAVKAVMTSMSVTTIHLGKTSPIQTQSSEKALFTIDTTAMSSPLPLVLQGYHAFAPAVCSNPMSFGLYCNISNTACDILQPCQNNGTCLNQNTSYQFGCACPSGFSGLLCESDNRLCQPNTCWHNGTCIATSQVTYACLCQSEWDGDRCEKRVNYCQNVTCENNGVCRSLYGSYACECLGDSYSGRYCENTASRIIARRIIAKSFAAVAIGAMSTAATFIMVMDILKYWFGIDPARREIKRRKSIRERKALNIVRYIYVHAPSSSDTDEPIDETTV